MIAIQLVRELFLQLEPIGRRSSTWCKAQANIEALNCVKIDPSTRNKIRVVKFLQLLRFSKMDTGQDKGDRQKNSFHAAIFIAGRSGVSTHFHNIATQRRYYRSVSFSSHASLARARANHVRITGHGLSM